MGITASQQTDQLVLHVSGEYDYRYKAGSKKDAICDTICALCNERIATASNQGSSSSGKSSGSNGGSSISEGHQDPPSTLSLMKVNYIADVDLKDRFVLV